MKYEECKKDYSILDDENFMRVVVAIPKRTAHMSVECEVYNEGELVKVIGDYPLEDVQECRNDYLLIDPDDDALIRYTLTEKGLEYAKSLKKEFGYE